MLNQTNWDRMFRIKFNKAINTCEELEIIPTSVFVTNLDAMIFVNNKLGLIKYLKDNGYNTISDCNEFNNFALLRKDDISFIIIN